MSDKIIDRDAFTSVGNITASIVSGLSTERRWDGETIKTDGVFSNIPLSTYHTKTDLLDGPSVSKSSLKWLLPTHGSSPKAFWGRWAYNPNHIKPKSSDALDFGKAVHCLLMRDESFADNFVVRPAEYPDYRTNAAKDWRDKALKAGKTIITEDQLERIERIHADAAEYPLVKLGILNGKVERSMFWKDPETGIWLRARPDVLAADGVFADLKTASSFSEDFLEKQIFDMGYYLQAAITRMVCRGLGIPFETFTLLYVLNDDVPDTAHVEIDEFDIDRGEKAVRWCLRTIRHCLDKGEWYGARPFNDGEKRIHMKEFQKTRLDAFLEMEGRMEAAE